MNIDTLNNTLFEHIRNTDKSFTQHFHDTYTIGITNDGLFKSKHLKKTYLSYKNSIRIANPGEMHGGDSSSWKYTNFYPTMELLSQIYEQIFFEKKIPIFEQHIIEDLVLYNFLYSLFQSVYKKEDSMKIEIKLIDTLSYLIKQYTHTTKDYDNLFNDKSIIKTSVEYIKDTLETNLTLDDLASNVSMSKYHFLRVFKQHLGITPHRYILTQKIDKARDKIINGSTISQASFEVGFSDQSHFTRNFKKLYGYTPKMIFNNNDILLYK